MKHITTRFGAVVLLAASAGAAQAVTPIDLSTWTALTLNFPGGQPAGNWSVAGGNTEVTQTVNADPSFFLNNQNQTSFKIDGTWQGLGSGDNDYMGFAFGYQNSSNFYLFDWKQGSQGYVGTNAAEGMTIKKFTGATGDGLVDLSLPEFWENEHDWEDMTVLATNHSSSAGWVTGRLYNFHLDFNVVPGQFTVIVKDGDTELWNRTVVDSTFTSGQFAFYNNSEANVRYAGFTQELIPVVPDVIPGVPEPQTYALMLLGIAAVGFAARRRAS